jgi:hypothetical protein
VSATVVVTEAPQVSALGVTTPHLAVIMMENKELGQVVGSANAPYVNNTLLPQARLFTNYYAVSHPSLPDYLVLTSGDDSGCVVDTCPRNSVAGNNLFQQLNDAGSTWKAYAEDMPSNCYASDSGPYLVRHNPPTYYTSLAGTGPGSCGANDVPWSALAGDLGTSSLPALMWLAPNQYDDMHTDRNTAPCQLGTALANQVCQGDTWLQQNLPTILSDGGRNDVTVLIAFDEGSSGAGGGGQVPLIEVGPNTCDGCTVSAPFDHHGLLNAIEDWFGVPRLSPAVPDLSGIAGDTTTPTAPGQPSGSSSAPGSISISWAASTDPDNTSFTYSVFRDGGPSSVGQVVSSQPTVSFTDTNLAPGSVHTYAVTASDGPNTSPPSPASDPITVASALFSDGFESGNFSAWNRAPGMSTESSDVFAGNFAATGTSSGSTTSFAEKTLSSTGTDLYAQTAVKVVSQGPKSINLLKFETASGSSIMTLVRVAGGNLELWNDGTSVLTFNPTILTTGVWHTIELHLTVAGASSRTEVWLDGVRQTKLALTTSAGTAPIGRLMIGDSVSGRTYQFDFDAASVSTAFIP